MGIRVQRAISLGLISQESQYRTHRSIQCCYIWGVNWHFAFYLDIELKCSKWINPAGCYQVPVHTLFPLLISLLRRDRKRGNGPCPQDLSHKNVEVTGVVKLLLDTKGQNFCCCCFVFKSWIPSVLTTKTLYLYTDKATQLLENFRIFKIIWIPLMQSPKNAYIVILFYFIFLVHQCQIPLTWICLY